MLVAVLCSACGDQIVGHYDDTNAEAETSSSSTAPDASSSSTGAPVETCVPLVFDGFDGDLIDDELWFTWQTADAAVSAIGGTLKFQPATTRVDDSMPADSGLVATAAQPVDPKNTGIRMQILEAPAIEDEVLTFLMFNDDTDEDEMVTITLADFVAVEGRDATGATSHRQEFPELTGPRWLGLRLDEDVVHYEVSSDGVEWETIFIGPVSAGFTEPRPLIMTQTYADSPNPSTVLVDNFTLCRFG